MLNRNKQHVMNQIERQGKIGEGLNRLKIYREQLDQALIQTTAFNKRIEDPDTWNRELRKKQKVEMMKM